MPVVFPERQLGVLRENDTNARHTGPERGRFPRHPGLPLPSLSWHWALTTGSQSDTFDWSGIPDASRCATTAACVATRIPSANCQDCGYSMRKCVFLAATSWHSASAGIWAAPWTMASARRVALKPADTAFRAPRWKGRGWRSEGAQSCHRGLAGSPSELRQLRTGNEPRINAHRVRSELAAGTNWSAGLHRLWRAAGGHPAPAPRPNRSGYWPGAACTAFLAIHHAIIPRPDETSGRTAGLTLAVSGRYSVRPIVGV